MHFRFLAGTFYSALTAFVLAGALWFAGVGPGFPVMFGFLLVIILPMVLGYHLSTASPASGNRPAHPAHMTRTQAGITVGVVYAIVFIYLAIPVIQVMAYSARPLTYKAIVQLALRNDLVTAMYLKPLDTGALVLIDEQRTKEISKVNLDFKKRLDALDAERPAESDTEAYNAWDVKMTDLMYEKAARISNINERWRLKKAALVENAMLADPVRDESGPEKSYNFILNLPGPLPMLVTLAIFLAVALFLISTFLSGKDQVRFRKVAVWWACVAIIAMLLPTVHRSQQELHARDSKLPPDLVPASLHQEPIPQFIAGDQMSTQNRWVRTGININKSTEIHILGNGLSNGNLTPCGSDGCDKQQLSGELLIPEDKHMTVIGRVGNGEIFPIHAGTVIDPDTLGTGELRVSVNQIADNDAAWNNMNGGFSIRVVGATP